MISPGGFSRRFTQGLDRDASGVAGWGFEKSLDVADFAGTPFAQNLARRDRLIRALQENRIRPPYTHETWSAFLSDRLARLERTQAADEALAQLNTELAGYLTEGGFGIPE